MSVETKEIGVKAVRRLTTVMTLKHLILFAIVIVGGGDISLLELACVCVFVCSFVRVVWSVRE
jgi:hypothetical protein